MPFTDPRVKILDQPNIAPLTKLIREMQGRTLRVPFADPNDGGIYAKTLFLMETPGPQAVQSGFVSCDNPDPAALNMKTSLDHAGFERNDYVLWNVVPQCISTKDQNRSASAGQIKAAAPDTQAFISRLERLMVIVFCGRQAQRAIRYLNIPNGIEMLMTFHTGAKAYNHLHMRDHIHRTFRLARRLIEKA